MDKKSELLLLEKDELIQIILKQQEDHDTLKHEVERFVENNFRGGSKSDRADYDVLVPCKDIWDLRKLVNSANMRQ